MAKTKTLTLGFIDGTGYASVLHLPGLLKMPDVRIAGVATLPDTRNPMVSWLPEVTDYGEDYVGLIEQERPDVVYAIIPPLRRYDVAVTILEAGCNLIINKPPAVTTEQIRQLALIARKHGVIAGVVFYRRFSSLVRRSKALCEARGAVHSAVATFYKNAIGRGPYERGGVDALTFDAIHAVDTIRYLCGGEVESVASNVRSLHTDWTNTHEAIIRFTTGAVGVVLTNFACGRRMFTIEAHGKGISCFGDIEEGGCVYADDKVEPIEILDALGDHDSEDYRQFGLPEMSVPIASWHTDTNKHLLDCVRAGQQPETSFEDATETMELVDAIYRCQI